jgi:hypothetical protein
MLCVASSTALAGEPPRHAVAAGTTAAGAGIGALLAVTAGLPLVYAGEASLGGAGANLGALVLLLAVPIGAGVGAGAMVASFNDGPAAWLAGGTVGAATLIAFFAATAGLQGNNNNPLAIMGVYAAPVVTAAVLGALTGMLAVPAQREPPE